MKSFALEVLRKSGARFSIRHVEQLAWKVIKGTRPELVKHGPLRLSLAWVTDKEIRKVNALYRGKNEATDVLSFSFVERNRPAQDGCIGELLISTETLKRQAKEQKHSMLVEADVLLVHGVLHILGHDHERPQQLAAMLKLEKKYLGDKAGLIARSLVET